EARLTALLLGELPDAEAAAVRKAIAADADLAKLYEQLKQTVALVREAAAWPSEPASTQPAPLKLADERRQKLLAQFKTVRPKEFARSPRRDLAWLVPMSAAAIIVGMVGVAMLQSTTSRAQRASSFANAEWFQHTAISGEQTPLAAARGL